ncbi:MAG TPA: glucose-1-phosphate thymidylyltransferase, partial [Bacteroidia bacterium]|nr:glucose-1-phosphate thymidylyltransferase [Bacteroidia bacterium]
LKIGCIEEIAYRMKFIDKEQLRKVAEPLTKSGYGNYLMKIIDQNL